MYSNATASTSYGDESPGMGKDRFTERITSWLKGVEPAAPSPETIVSRSPRRKARQSKPYSRPAALLYESHGSSSTDEYPGSSQLPDPRQTILELQNSSRIDRGLRSLPHPNNNPLITPCPEDLQEEYARIVLLYNMIEEKKQPVESLWLQRPSVTVMKELDDIELSGQRVIDAAQYIVDFAYSLRLDIDFPKIFLRYRSPSETTESNGRRTAVRRI